MFVLDREPTAPIRGLSLSFNRGQRFVFNGSLWLSTDANYIMEDKVSVRLLKEGEPLRDPDGEDTFELELGLVYRMLALPRTRILFKPDLYQLKVVINAPRNVIIEREVVYWRNRSQSPFTPPVQTHSTQD